MSAGRAIVVGGGLAGMTCALTLAGAGARVLLLEAGPVLGGRWCTEGTFELEHHGRRWTFPVEHGLHGVWRQYHNLRRLLATHGLLTDFAPAGEQSLVFATENGPPSMASIGTVVRDTPLPDAFAQLAIFADPALRAAALAEGPGALARAAWDLGHAYAFEAARDAARYDHLRVSELVERWPPVLQRMFGALTHSAFFRDPDEVSLSAFFAGLEVYSLRDKRNSSFLVAREDSGRAVFGPLQRAFEAAGGEVRLGRPVSGLLMNQGRCGGVTLAGGGTQAADAVCLAVDPSSFERLQGLGPAGLERPPRDLGAPSIVVRLLFDRALGLRPDRPASGVLAEGEVDNYFWLDRLQTPFAAWATATGGTALECHLYGLRARRAAALGDAELLTRITPTLERIWPGLAGRRVGAHVRRNAPCHTTFPPGTFASLPGVETRLPNLALCGDWIALPDCSLYLERAAHTGLRAARALAPALGLDPAWMPLPLPVDPPAPSMRFSRGLARILRRRGALPRLRSD